VKDERRVYQRLTLTEPLDGWFGDYPVRIVDVSASGAQIEHEEDLPSDANGLLRFWWTGAELEILAKTARSIGTTRSGLQFLEESDVLRPLIEASATTAMRAFEANAQGNRGANVIGDETITSISKPLASGFVTWIFSNGRWHAQFSHDSTQPPDGFTISAGEPEEEVEMLRQTYESGDAESRRLTRILAELSVK
jgi:hypothetical protein